MNNLFDIVMNAQGGAAMDTMARSFGLTPDQTRAAVQALLPAFSMGLERQAQSADALGNLMKMMTGSGYQNAFATAGSGLQATAMGNDALGTLFGSKDLSRAVALQASQATGIGTDILKAMLPIIASILMGGLGRSMTQGGGGGILGQILGGLLGAGQQQSGGAMGGGGLGDILGGILGGGQPSPQQNPAGGGAGGLGDVLRDALGGGNGQAAPSRTGGAAPQGNASLDDMINEALGGSQGTGSARQAQPDAQSPTSGAGGLGDLLGSILGGAMNQGQPQAGGARTPNPMDIFGDLFKTGVNQQQQHVDQMASIFEQFLGKR